MVWFKEDNIIIGMYVTIQSVFFNVMTSCITQYFVCLLCVYTGRFIMFSMITNIHNKKTKGPTLMEFFTATGKLKKFFFDN